MKEGCAEISHKKLSRDLKSMKKNTIKRYISYPMHLERLGMACITPFITLVTFLLIIIPLFAHAEDGVTAGRFVVEPPTLQCAGFEWYIDGDDNRTSSVAVKFREQDPIHKYQETGDFVIVLNIKEPVGKARRMKVRNVTVK